MIRPLGLLCRKLEPKLAKNPIMFTNEKRNLKEMVVFCAHFGFILLQLKLRWIGMESIGVMDDFTVASSACEDGSHPMETMISDNRI